MDDFIYLVSNISFTMMKIIYIKKRIAANKRFYALLLILELNVHKKTNKNLHDNVPYSISVSKENVATIVKNSEASNKCYLSYKEKTN